MNVEAVPPFEFGHSLRFLDGFTPCAGDHRCEPGRLVTGGFVDEQPFVADVSAESGAADRLAVDVHWVDEPGEESAVADWLSAFLSLDDDLTALYDAASEDPAFERVVQDLYGYHHVRFPTPFEAACWAALSQQTPMNLARQQKRTLVEACGRVVEYDGRDVTLFPTPEMVRSAAGRIDDRITNDRKTRTLREVTTAFAEDSLGELDDGALIERLTDIWGFGEWSSEFVSLRGFGRLSRVPRTERRLRVAVADLYDLDGQVATDDQLDSLSDPYGSAAGHWAHYVRVWEFLHS